MEFVTEPSGRNRREVGENIEERLRRDFTDNIHGMEDTAESRRKLTFFSQAGTNFSVDVVGKPNDGFIVRVSGSVSERNPDDQSDVGVLNEEFDRVVSIVKQEVPDLVEVLK